MIIEIIQCIVGNKRTVASNMLNNTVIILGRAVIF